MQPQSAPQWREVEIALTGPGADNPYTEVDAWVIFYSRQWTGGAASGVLGRREPRTACGLPPPNRTAYGSGAFTRTDLIIASRLLPAP
jgi:hypothetical protein